MNIETIKVFRDLVDTGSFSKTAELNYISQSAVSQQIKNLDFVLKSRLLNRSANRILPTPCGEIFYEAARRIILVYENAVVSTRQFSVPSPAEEVRISTIYSAGIYLLQGYIRKFMAAQRDAKVSVEYRQCRQIRSDIRSGRADFGIIAGPCNKPQGLIFLPIGEDKMVLLTGMSDKLARKRAIAVREIEGHDFVAFERNSPSRKCVDEFFRKHAVKVNMKMELDDIETIKTAVSSGAGLALLPLSAVREAEREKELHIVRFNDAQPRRFLYLIYNRSRKMSASAKTFLDITMRHGTQICGG
ncbi:MAG: LysR family transcriptional regulator [Elusimicrobiales bacterium]